MNKLKIHLKTKHGLACGARTDFFYSGGLAHFSTAKEEEFNQFDSIGRSCKKCSAALKRYKKNNYNFKI